MELCNSTCVSFTSRSIVCDDKHFFFSNRRRRRRRRRDAGLSICPRSFLSYQQWHIQKKRENLVCRNCQQQEAPLHNSSTSNQTLRNTEENELAFMLIHEKIGNTVMRKYAVDENQSLSIEDIQMEYVPCLSNTTSSPGDQVGWVLLSVSIPQMFKDFFLPTDFPDSVSHDYLRYMIWQLPTNVTGWACSTLVTSSLLKAVGVEAWAGTTIAATAAIKWVSKDGLGAFGRLFIGGRFGRVFDDDPKQWRMYAELIGSFGSIFELMTPIKPEWFLPLAALGRLTKAVGRGLKDPSFRVIQNHFAIAGNMGEVSAKEEVWEVSAELIGIALGVALLASPSLAASYSTLVLTWASIRSLHLWFRYQSLASLQFPTINFKRAFIMAELHVIGSPIPGISACNFVENILLPWQFSKPHLQLGCSLRDALGGQVSVSELEALLGLYSDELHVLVLHPNAVRVIFKEGATNVTILRCIWQAEWIMASTMPQSSLFSSMPWRAESCTLDDQMSLVARSLQELNEHFDDFLQKVEQAGWETSKLVLKVPKDAPYLAISTSTEHCNRKTKSL